MNIICLDGDNENKIKYIIASGKLIDSEYEIKKFIRLENYNIRDNDDYIIEISSSKLEHDHVSLIKVSNGYNTCNGCEFDYKGELRIFNCPSELGCDYSIYVKKSEDKLHNTITINDLKSAVCTSDICIYKSDTCDNDKNSVCLFRIIKSRINETNKCS